MKKSMMILSFGSALVLGSMCGVALASNGLQSKSSNAVNQSTPSSVTGAPQGKVSNTMRYSGSSVPGAPMHHLITS